MKKITAWRRHSIFQFLLYFLLLFSGSALASEKIVLQLKWLHQFQFAGYYAALEQGYFAEEGLDVELRERNTEISNIDQVLTGEADYGVTDSIVLLHHVEKSGVVLVTPIFQHSPNVLMALRSSNINNPRDLVGRRLAFYDNDTDGISLLAMLVEQDVLKDGLLRFNLEDRINRLISGEVDAIAAYSTNEPQLLKEMGYPVTVIDPKHYGIDFYGDVLFTTTKEAENHAERVEAMQRAVLRGWEYALDHKDEIIKLILQKYNTQNKTYAALMVEAQGLEPLIARHTTELGTLTSGRLEYMLNVLAKTKIVDINLDQVEVRKNISRLIFNSEKTELNLTDEEWAFLATSPLIQVGIDRNWPPFEYLNTNDVGLQGISRDYLALLEQLLFLKFDIKDSLSWLETLSETKAGRIDLLPAITDTPDRRRYLSFTQPYVRSPMVIVTNYKTSFIADISELNSKRVAVVNGHASHEMIAKNHPSIKLELKNSAIESLKAVASGEVDAYIGNLAVVSYLIRTNGLANLKVSGQTPYSFDLSMAVQKDQPLLASILDKALKHISRQQHSSIYDSWVDLDVEKGFPWGRFLTLFLSLSVLLFILGFYTLRLVKLNQHIQEVNAKLKQTESKLREKNLQLEKLSITDKLTGVYNRHYLDRVLNEQIDLVQRYQKPMSIALFDLDLFKNVNDKFGHQMGDEVLKKFAEIVHKNIRKTDVFGRWGGEEFLLILPETTTLQASEVANKIRQALEEQFFVDTLKQTVSAGVVEAEPNLTVDELLSLADKHLYSAKNTGRNKVTC